MRDSFYSITKAEGGTLCGRKAIATLLLLALLASSPLLGVSLAAPRAQESTVDAQVWRDLEEAADHQATFAVALHLPPGQGADAAVDGQMALEGPLQALQRAGSVRSFTPYYGANAIVVTGSRSAVLFLAGQPNVASIGPYQAGEAWETTFRVDRLVATGQITGRVTGPDGTTPLPGIGVTVYRQTGPLSWPQAGTASTNATGNYTIGGLPTGIYRARFRDPSGNYVREYYNDKPSFTLATNFDVTDGQTTSGIDASLAQAGRIAGTVTDLNGGSPVADIVVTAWYFDGAAWALAPESDNSDSSGQYVIGGLAPGIYRLKFDDIYTPARYVPEYYNNKSTVEDGDDVSVTGGATTSGINAALGQYGKIAGTVKAEDGTTLLAHISVDVYEPDGSGGWQWASFDETDAAGQYEAGGLVTRDYRVAFSDGLSPAQYATEYYNNKSSLSTGDNVHVELGATTGNINATLALMPMTVNLPLASGWNLMSLSLNPSSPAPADALTSIAGNYDVVWAYDACDTSVPWDPWKKYDPDLPTGNDLTAMDGADGYWLESKAAVSLQVTGQRPFATSVPLCSGWNLIGYPAGVAKAVTTVLSGIAGKYDLVYGYDAASPSDPWKVYDPYFPVGNTLTTMQPGKGYWILMNQNATLTIYGR